MNSSQFYNIGTIVFLVLTVLVGVFYCLIAFNVVTLFPEPPLPTLLPTNPPPTATPIPTWTPLPSDTPPGGSGEEPTPTEETLGSIPEPTSAPASLGGSASEPPTPSPVDSGGSASTGQSGAENPAEDEAFAFTLQGEGPSFVPQYLYPAEGCQWQGIAGQVFGLAGEELTENLVVHVWGPGIDTLVTVGSNPNYGDSGWDVWLGEETSTESYSIQLLNSSNQQQLSDAYEVTFSNSCAANLAIVYFQQLDAF